MKDALEHKGNLSFSLNQICPKVKEKDTNKPETMMVKESFNQN